MIAFLDLIDDEEDKKRFEELYYKYKDLVMWIAMQKLHSQNNAEDCVQETFFYLAKNFNKVDYQNVGKTKCYISTIAEGFAIKQYNKDSKTSSVSMDDEDVNIDSILFDYSSTDEFEKYNIEDLKNAIDSLSDEYKNLIYLTYYFGYKSKEIAAMYSMTDALVRKKIQFAKKQIKGYFESGV